VSDFFIFFYLLDVLDLLFDLITIYLIAKSKKTIETPFGASVNKKNRYFLIFQGLRPW